MTHAGKLEEGTRPELLLEECRPYFDLTPEERDRIRRSVCRTAMRQWLALPEGQRRRWPPEPGPEGEAVLRRWVRELRERTQAPSGR